MQKLALQEAERLAAHPLDGLVRARTPILNALYECVVITDADGRIVFVNPSAERMLGQNPLALTSDQFSSDFGLETVDGEAFAEGAFPLSRAALAGETVENAVWRIRKGPNRGLIAVGSARPLDYEGTHIGAVLTFRDDTERQDAEQALRASEARLRAIIAATPECVKIVAEDGSLLEMNPAGLAMVESDCFEEVDGACIFDVIAPEDRAEWEERHRRVCAGESLGWEFAIVGLKGTRRRMETHAVPIALEDGRTGQLAVTRDVTERRSAEQALRANEARFRAVFENAGVGMLEIDADWRILGANAAYSEITGYDLDELIGRNCLAFTHADDVGISEAALSSLSDSLSRTSFEKRYVRKDGRTIWIRSNLARISASGEPPRFLKIVEDIDARKRAEVLSDAQRIALELALAEAPLAESLGALARTAEKHSSSQVLASILLLDDSGKRLLHGAAPSLPQSYCDAIHGVEIGPDVGSCGTAAFRGEPVIVRDIATDPLWKNFRDLALDHGLRACWSTPIRGSSGALLGTFAMYYPEPRAPSAEDIQLVESISRSGALIIERAQSAEALRERRDEFHALADNIPTLCWMAHSDGDIFWFNRRWYEYTGTTPVSQQGWGWESVHDPDVLPGVVERWKHSIATGEPFEMTFPLKGADGRFRPFLTRVVPIRDEGRIVRWFGTNVDVSEQVRAEEQLREESHNLEILNRVGSAIASELDLDRIVQMVTDAGVELTGAHFGAFFYNVIDDKGEGYTLYTISGVDRSEFDKFPMPRNTKVFAPTFNGEGTVRSDDITKDPRYGHNRPYRGMPKGHLPVVSYLAVPVASHTGEVLGGLFFGHPEPGRFKERHERLMEGIAAQAAIAVDNARLYREAQREIEQRVRAEQALTALNETLESRVAEEIARRSQAEEVLRQAQKMETVGQLSGGIAHDFNNLLQIIHGNLSLLERAEKPGDQKWRRAVANALTGTDRAAALTQRLLAFSRRQPLDPRPIDVNRLITDMTELLHRTLGEMIVIETHLVSGIPSALVDGNQLENAILNLAVNARDAMPRGGRLAIATGAVEIGRDHSELSPGRYINIQVRDTGEGMSPEVLERALEPFFSTKEVGQGTGLGLPMVYGFVRQSGGSLVLHSREGEGTSVDLYLPCSSAEPLPREPKSARETMPRGRGERILLCEDDDGVRLFSSETLRDLGYEVVEARDASEALDLMRSRGPFDLLFTDVVLPGGQTGADLAQNARKVQDGIKVLFTTGYARSALDKESRGGKAVELLLKPFSVDKLAAKVREMLG